MEKKKAYIHHVMIAADDLERSRRFYRDVLEFEEIKRPQMDYPGLWFRLGDGECTIHVLVRPDATLRRSKGNDPYDVHFAIRVKSYRETLAWLRGKGLHDGLPDGDPPNLQLRPNSVSGNPQIFVLDPDHNIVEFNCETID